MVHLELRFKYELSSQKWVKKVLMPNEWQMRLVYRNTKIVDHKQLPQEVNFERLLWIIRSRNMCKVMIRSRMIVALKAITRGYQIFLTTKHLEMTKEWHIARVSSIAIKHSSINTKWRNYCTRKWHQLQVENFHDHLY